MGLPFSSLYYLDRARKIIPIWVAEATGAETAAIEATEESECDDFLLDHYPDLELSLIFVCFFGKIFARKTGYGRVALPILLIIHRIVWNFSRTASCFCRTD